MLRDIKKQYEWDWHCEKWMQWSSQIVSSISDSQSLTIKTECIFENTVFLKARREV